jgi:hypothetical protein
MEIGPGFSPKYIEVELLAAAFSVEGEKRQRREVFAAPMIYQWNISPPKSGIYEMGLVFRAEDASGRIRELGVITQRVSVMKIDGLTS